MKKDTVPNTRTKQGGKATACKLEIKTKGNTCPERAKIKTTLQPRSRRRCRTKKLPTFPGTKLNATKTPRRPRPTTTSQMNPRSALSDHQTLKPETNHQPSKPKTKKRGGEVET